MKDNMEKEWTKIIIIIIFVLFFIWFAMLIVDLNASQKTENWNKCTFEIFETYSSDEFGGYSLVILKNMETHEMILIDRNEPRVLEWLIGLEKETRVVLKQRTNIWGNPDYEFVRIAE